VAASHEDPPPAREAEALSPAGRLLSRGEVAYGAGNLLLARRHWIDCSRLAAPESVKAQARLLDMNRAHVYPAWKNVRRGELILVASPGSPAARQPDAFLEARQRVIEAIARRLGVVIGEPITFYVYASSREGEQLLGRPLAFAVPERSEVHIRHDQEPGHEEAHLIAWLWNRKGSGVPFLEEGLAVALSTHPGSPHAAAAEDLARGALPALADLVERFRQFDNGYPLAGSFVADLMERSGVEVIRRLYAGEGSSFLARLQRETGQTIEDLQAAWETSLASLGTASREPVLEALSLLAFDRVAEAIALLEKNAVEHPDNPVIEYALACARRAAGDARGSAVAYRRLLARELPYHFAWMRQRAVQALEEMGLPQVSPAAPGAR
jgi:hypothetical protein